MVIIPCLDLTLLHTQLPNLPGKKVLYQVLKSTVFDENGSQCLCSLLPLPPLVMLVLSKGRKVSDRGYTATGLFIPLLKT